MSERATPAAKRGKTSAVSTDDPIDAARTSEDHYVDRSLTYNDIQRTMKDPNYIRIWKQAILQNKHLFAGKVVLDVGCGVGYRSMLAAQAGARVVYAVAELNADVVTKIVAANGHEATISVLQQPLDDIQLADGTVVDVIISDWIGHRPVLSESLLPAVIRARDRWLAADGVILPNKLRYFITGVEDLEGTCEKLDFWENVYGFGMRCMQQLVKSKPSEVQFGPQQQVTYSEELLNLNIMECSLSDVNFSTDFQLHALASTYDSTHTQTQSREGRAIDAFLLHFDFEFSHGHCKPYLSTGVRARSTHWPHALYRLDQPVTIYPDETVGGVGRCAYIEPAVVGTKHPASRQYKCLLDLPTAAVLEASRHANPL